MLNEPASSRENQAILRAPQPPPSREEVQFNAIRQAVASVLAIEKEHFLESEKETTASAVPAGALPTHLVATFEGRLLLGSEQAYDQLDAQLAPTNHLPIFREADPKKNETSGPHVVHILTGRINPQPRPWWPNLLLFIATIFSVLLLGTELAVSQIQDPAEIERIANNLFMELWRGLPYAFSILLILGTHELGHYFAARRHKLAVTLPYFIPLPFISLFGTMGAFIQLRQPMKNRKVLLDVGAAGPLAGLIFAVPILFIGLASTQVIPIGGGGYYEGDSILYALAKVVTFGHFLPDGKQDVCINCSQLQYAGWTGLLVTALNLIPIGQLDGGHVLYSLIGERARKLYLPLLGVMIILVLFTEVWLLWVVLLLFFGRVYATPLDMITPLDNRRRVVAILSLIIFVFIFVPAPMTPLAGGPAQPLVEPRNAASLLPLVAAPALVWVQARLRR